jgi:hypothetical protein
MSTRPGNPIRLARRISLIACLALLGLAMACPSGRSSDAISGKIQVKKDQELRPVAQAQVRLSPISPDPEAKGADEQPEDPANLRGVSITNDTGYFDILSLSSDQTFQEYGLLRNWRYEIQIQVPGYYIYKGNFAYSKGAEALEITLEAKGADVVDDSGVIEMDEKAIQSGSIRRGS